MWGVGIELNWIPWIVCLVSMYTVNNANQLIYYLLINTLIYIYIGIYILKNMYKYFISTNFKYEKYSIFLKDS